MITFKIRFWSGTFFITIFKLDCCGSYNKLKNCKPMKFITVLGQHSQVFLLIERVNTLIRGPNV